MSDQSKTFGCGTFLPGYGDPPVVIPVSDVDEPGGDDGGGDDTTPIGDDWEQDDPIVVDGGGGPPAPWPPIPVPDDGDGDGGGGGIGAPGAPAARCECVIIGGGESKTPGPDGSLGPDAPAGAVGGAVFKQKCTQLGPAAASPKPSKPWRRLLGKLKKEGRRTTTKGEIGKGCVGNPPTKCKCSNTDCCPEVEVYWGPASSVDTTDATSINYNFDAGVVVTVDTETDDTNFDAIDGNFDDGLDVTVDFGDNDDTTVYVDAGGAIEYEGDTDVDDGDGVTVIDAGDGVIIDVGPGGDGGPGGDFTVADDKKSTGGAITNTTEYSRRGLMSTIRTAGAISLDALKSFILQKSPTGVIDSDIAIGGDAPIERGFVKNTRGNTDIFAEKIDSRILYILQNNNSTANWNATAISRIGRSDLLNSLNPTFLETLRSIRKIDGSKLSDKQIYNLVMRRIITGTIGKLDVRRYRYLAEKTAKRANTEIIPSSNKTVNQVAALSLIEKNLIPLDPDAHDTQRAKELVKNWKVCSTDIARYLPIVVDNVPQRYYIDDNDRLMDRSTLSLQDGEYFIVREGDTETKIFTESEKDHGYIVEEKIRQRAIKLLGGTGTRTLSVSANFADNVEYTHSLTNPRQNAYIMKVLPETIESTPAGTMLKKTKVRYELMDTTTPEGVRAVNDYIRYKVNHRSILVADDDILLDYIEQLGFVQLEQEDILFDTAKTNKTMPLLVKQIPWYLVIVPTNIEANLTYGARSKLVRTEADGSLTRQLTTTPAVDPVYSSSKTSKFIKIRAAWPEHPDVLGNEANVQTRIAEFSPDTAQFRTMYRSADQSLPAISYTPNRRKSPIRVIKEIIRELNANYVLETDGLGTGVNAFDIVSRLTMSEYNRLKTTEVLGGFITQIKNGLFDGVKVYPSVRGAGEASRRKTRLFKRRATAQPDRFPSLKSKNNGGFIRPPTTEPRSSTIVTAVPIEDKQTASSARGGGITIL